MSVFLHNNVYVPALYQGILLPLKRKENEENLNGNKTKCFRKDFGPISFYPNLFGHLFIYIYIQEYCTNPYFLCTISALITLI